MRVLHVEGGAHLYGGAQQVLYLLEGLAERGVENHLACRRCSELAMRAVGSAEVHGIPMHGDLDFALIPRLYRLTRKLSPNLVHLQSRIGADLMGGIAARIARLPVVHTRRVDNPEPRWLVRRKYRLHDRVIAISNGIAEILRTEGLPESKLRIVRSAIAAEQFAQPCRREQVADQLGLPADSILIGVVAQLIPRKGHAVLLRAAPALLAEQPRLHIAFFGQGPLAASLQQQIDAAALGGRIHLMGFRDDLASIFPCLRLLVHPALMEGLGISLLQGAAAAVPVVASDVGGIPEAVSDQVTGLLVPPGDAEALAYAIRRLLADDGLSRRLGATGADRIRREFSVDAMVTGNLAVYRELVGDRCP
jgi:glycosyltransferase involved in cell wall biosynthesis